MPNTVGFVNYSDLLKTCEVHVNSALAPTSIFCHGLQISMIVNSTTVKMEDSVLMG